MKKVFFLLCILLSSCNNSTKQTTGFEPDFTPSVDLEADFLAPPDYAKPRVYWWWLEGNISKEGILSDLTEMKKVGIKGAILFDAGSSSYGNMVHTAAGPVFMSPEWRELFVYACRVADSLDLEISTNITSGWNDGGPWVTPEYTSKKLVWSELSVKGPAKLSEQLPLPEGLLTYRTDGEANGETNGETNGEASGETFYRPVAVLAVKLRENSDSVLPLENIKLKAVHSISIPKTKNGLGYNWNLLMKEEASPEGDCHAFLRDVTDITDKIDAEGNINWEVPEGNYLIMRFGYTGTGIRVSTNSPGGGGLAIDYMSRRATDLQYDHTAAVILKDLQNTGFGKSLKYLHDDSWELGPANWTDDFTEEFSKATGYDLRLFLPVITGRIIESRDVSNKILYDFRRMIADLVWANHYRHFMERAHSDGLGVHPESGGPHPAPIDALKNEGLNDIPMGEFWIRSKTHRVAQEDRLFVKQPASVAHIYGRRFVQAEGPTSIGPHWEEDFAYMKPTLDRVYCEGLNRFVIHTFTHSPKDAGTPGNEYFAGTHANPNVTWWRQAPAFMTWNSRISFMLSQGLFVGDVCYYYGDNVPNQVPLKHVNEDLGEGYDYDVCNTQVILERMTVRDGKIYLPDGMSYQALVLPPHKGIHPDVAKKLEKMKREGATIVMDNGQLTIDNGELSKNGQLTIDNGELSKNNDKQLTSNDGESTKKKNDGELSKNDEQLSIVNSQLSIKSGQLSIVNYQLSIKEALAAKGVLPDFTYKSAKPDALIDYIHRTTDDAEIYYIVNRNERPEYVHLTFRVEGKTPELWRPETGEIIDWPIYNSIGGLTSLPLFLEPFGSVFVVFRKPAAAHYESIALNGKSLFPELPQDTFDVQPFILQKDGNPVFMLAGTYTLKSSDGKTLTFDAATENIPVTSAWDVSFDPAWGGPEKVRFDKLVLWNGHANPGIRYYSGTAEYNTSVRLEAGQYQHKRVYLDLGEMYNIAEVYINGQAAGVWWQPPFAHDITDLLKDGENKLQINVVNLWPNRLIGDASLPEEQRLTQTNVRKFTKDYPLRPSGLVGPVNLKIYDNRK